MVTNKIALITGITGQDGSYLAEFLLDKGYYVHGIVRPLGGNGFERLAHLCQNGEIYGKRLFFHSVDLNDYKRLMKLFEECKPEEVYHLAAQSFLGSSFETPESTLRDVALTTLNLLEVCRQQQCSIRFFYASSSEVFGASSQSPQNENTAFRPTSPYGCAKAYATQICQVYRSSYGLFVCSGILYNHESPRRADIFVTRKITKAAARIKLGLQSELYLGNLNSRRDWGYAGDYVRAMWLMLQQDVADDFIIASGEAHSVREFIEEVFSLLELDWQKYVKYDVQHERLDEANLVLGDLSKIKRKLGWKSELSFKELVKLMVEADYRLAEEEAREEAGIRDKSFC